MAKEHKASTLGNRHPPHNWEYADATARLAATGFLPADVGELARQLDTNVLWMLTDDSPATWQSVAATSVTGTFTTEEGDVAVSAATATLDFDASDFNLTESPAGEVNVGLNYGTGAGQPAEGTHAHAGVLSTVTLAFGDGTNVIASTERPQRFTVPVGMTITKRIVRSEDGTSGSIEFLVKRAAAGSTTFTEISASPDRPALSSDTEDTSTDFSSWTDTTLDAEDTVETRVNGSPTSVKDVSVVFILSRSL